MPAHPDSDFPIGPIGDDGKPLFRPPLNFPVERYAEPDPPAQPLLIHIISHKNFDPTQMEDIKVIEMGRTDSEARVTALIAEGYKAYSVQVEIRQIMGTQYHETVITLAKLRAGEIENEALS